MTLGLPSYVRERLPSGERRVDDGLYWPSGFLFPENREELWPMRQFPLRGLDESLELDATVEEIQAMGLQYTVFVQMLREEGFELELPGSWSRSQSLWTDINVFSEEVCEWHFPRVQRGFNIDQIPMPELLRPEVNRPEYLGYLPNGDLVLYWELANALSQTFDLDTEPVPSTLDGRCFVASRGCDEEAIFDTPVGQGGEVGIILSRKERGQIPAAVGYLQGLGGTTRVFDYNPDFSMFYRLSVPIFRCEAGLNAYQEMRWDDVDVTFDRLLGFSFNILDNPVTRAQPLFSTERGNLIASQELLSLMQDLCAPLRANPGKSLPVVRTP